MSVFGSRKKDEQAIQRRGLGETEEMLQKKADLIEKKIEQETFLARKNATQKKRIALEALKRKKRYEKQLQQIDGMLTMIKLVGEALEDASTNTEVLMLMKQEAKALMSAQQNMDVDQAHDLMDEVAEQVEIANGISEAISNPVGFQQDVDDDDLMAELEELKQEELDERLPSVPTDPVASKYSIFRRFLNLLDKMLPPWLSKRLFI